ncbi:MAG TPA: PAS domain-containing protein, partial [Terriglobia bacterium]|nr:PAS domain-containing protein [Terriglobia bacterium]
MADLDCQIAARCVSELKSAGFEPVVDEVQTLSQVQEALATHDYDVVLIPRLLPATTEDAALEGEINGETPFILIESAAPESTFNGPLVSPSTAPTDGKTRTGELIAVIDVLPPDDLRRLPFAVNRALEITALREEKETAQQRYRSLFERSVAGIYQASLDGRILDLNDACMRMLTCSSKERIIGCPLLEITASRDEYDRLMRPLLERQTVTSLEIKLQRLDGEPLWALASASVLDYGKDVLIEGTLIEITKWKQAEELVQQSEKRFKALVENSSDAISLVDATGKVLLSSHAVSPIFGYALEERVGKNLFELIHPEDQQHVARSFQKLLQ